MGREAGGEKMRKLRTDAKARRSDPIVSSRMDKEYIYKIKNGHVFWATLIIFGKRKRCQIWVPGLL